MVTDVGFYHCTRSPLLQVAVRLAEKAYAGDQRMLIAGDAALLEELDELLWTYSDASFLPHAIAGRLDDSEQPLLLSPDISQPPANGARLLMLLASAVPAEFAAFDRILNLFEEGTAAQVQARADWRRLASDADAGCSYWQQTERGGWQKQGS